MPYFHLILSVLIVCLFGASQPSTRPLPTETNKPNVLVILVDDMGAKDLGYTGSKFYETPHIDKLASESMIFTNGYSNSSVCSPSRASIFTGQFTARHGITDWIGAQYGQTRANSHPNDKLLPPKYANALPKEDTTLAEAMKLGGYKTFFAGKWHLGDNNNSPENNGFDINIGGWAKGSPKGGYFSPWLNPNLPNGPNGQNLTMRLADETVSFMRENKEEPFFAMLSFYAVHGPVQTTKEKWAKYQAKAVKQGIAKEGFGLERKLPYRLHQDHPEYAGLVETMDDAVGEVLQALIDLGIDQNTIVIFTSDNGGVTSGDAYATSNQPYRGGKGYQWEGGFRVPFLIKTPGHGLSGQETSTRVTGADIYPTILDLTELPSLPHQHRDGLSLKPLLLGESIPERPLYWHYPHYGNQGGDPNSIVVENNWKLIYYWETEKVELYDLSNDISETTDLSNQYPERASTLKAKLLQWLDDVGGQSPTVSATYNKEKAAAEILKRKTQLKQTLETKRKQMLSPSYTAPGNWYGSD